MEIDEAAATSNEALVLRSNPYIVNSKLILPTVYNFRRHFILAGRYFYRLHSAGVPTFSRTDVFNGDVLLYTPADFDEHHQGIQQLHYFKPISDDLGILVYVHGNRDESPTQVYISLISVCHTTQKFTVLSCEKFRWFLPSFVAQGTLIQNTHDLGKMICIFTDSSSDQGFRDQSCITFFKIRDAEVRITKLLLMRTAIYFPCWHGMYIDGIFEDEFDENIHHLQRYNIRDETSETLAENVLQFLVGHEYVSDFCWHRNDLFMFVLAQDVTKVYIQKFDLLQRKFTRINFPVDEFACVSKLSRFYINTDSIICYCETVENGEIQTDRYIRIPMRCPDKLLNYSWIAVRDFCERDKKSLALPLTFKYLSPVRPLLRFDQPSVSVPDAMELLDLGNATDSNDEIGKNSNNLNCMPHSNGNNLNEN